VGERPGGMGRHGREKDERRKEYEKNNFFVGIFLINFPTPRAIKKMASVPIRPESAV